MPVGWLTWSQFGEVWQKAGGLVTTHSSSPLKKSQWWQFIRFIRLNVNDESAKDFILIVVELEIHKIILIVKKQPNIAQRLKK